MVIIPSQSNNSGPPNMTPKDRNYALHKTNCWGHANKGCHIYKACFNLFANVNFIFFAFKDRLPLMCHLHIGWVEVKTQVMTTFHHSKW